MRDQGGGEIGERYPQRFLGVAIQCGTECLGILGDSQWEYLRALGPNRVDHFHAGIRFKGQHGVASQPGRSRKIAENAWMKDRTTRDETLAEIGEAFDKAAIAERRRFVCFRRNRGLDCGPSLKAGMNLAQEPREIVFVFGRMSAMRGKILGAVAVSVEPEYSRYLEDQGMKCARIARGAARVFDADYLRPHFIPEHGLGAQGGGETCGWTGKSEGCAKMRQGEQRKNSFHTCL